MNKLTKEKLVATVDHIITTAKNQTYNDGITSMLLDQRADKPEVVTTSKLDEIYNLTLSLLTKVYGQHSDPVQNFQKQLSDYLNPRVHFEWKDILALCVGKLNFLKVEIELDLLTTFEKEISSEVYGDFLSMAREALENGIKETSSVLACAALEDSLKKLARINGLDTTDKGMTEIANSLKGIGYLKGVQGTLINSFIKIRNKAFHAEWDKIDTPDGKSLIGFTEEFIATNF